MFAYSSILTCLILLPLVSALIIAMLPSTGTRLIRNAALAVCAGELALAIAVARLLNWHAGWQLMQHMAWFGGLSFTVGADPLTGLTVLALTGMGLITVLASYVVEEQIKTWYVLLLVLLACLLGAVCSMDLILQAAFGAISILPGYFLLGLWGGGFPSRRGHEICACLHSWRDGPVYQYHADLVAQRSAPGSAGARRRRGPSAASRRGYGVCRSSVI